MNALRAALFAALVAVPAAAVQPQFHRLEGVSDFLEGELENLSVDSLGRLRLGANATVLHDPGTPYVWSVIRDGKGTVYLGTGNDGKIFAIDASGHAKEFFDAPELDVHALAIGPDDRLYAATSPDGKVYAIDRAGKAETFYDPTDKYIWGLAFDGQGQLFVATGAEARLHRVDAKGEAAIVLTTAETHFTALAVDPRGHAFVGSAPGGIVYEVDVKGVGRVLADTGYKEVKALVPTGAGGAYAAVVDGRDRTTDRTRAATPPVPGGPAPSPSPAAPEIASQPPGFEGVAVVVSATPSGPTPPRGPQKGAVLLLGREGDVELLWASSEETPLALAAARGGVAFGTGAGRGKVYEVRDDRTWTLLASFTSQQVTGLVTGSGSGLVAAVSNPGRAHRLEVAAAASGTLTSKVRDTDTLSSWGQLSWSAQVPRGTRVELQTRTGNTGTPDSTWSEWSGPLVDAEGSAVTSPRGRFVQLRATLHGGGDATPILDGLRLAFLQRNLRPVVASVTVHPAGDVFGRPLSTGTETEILGLEPGAGPQMRRPGTRPPALNLGMSRRLFVRGLQALTWRAEDQNGDELRYDLHYRRVGDTRYRPLQRGLEDAVFTWDTSTVPNGRYVVRVTATDAIANPVPLAQSGERESAVFDIDNTPPAVTASLESRQVRAQVTDADTPIRKVEFALDGSRWQELQPQDGLCDSRAETFAFEPPKAEGPGPHVLVLRATDSLGNVGTARVEIP